MTEAEWKRKRDVLQLVRVALKSRRRSARTLRLYVAAFYTWFATRSTDSRKTDAVADFLELVGWLESWAETGIEPAKVRRYREATDDRGFAGFAAQATTAVLSTAVGIFQSREKEVTSAAIGLLRDIFGNPFRKVKFDKRWRTSTVVALASQMYESRDFSAMPILADALQDAGCDNDDILNHCRHEQAIHVRGCWVVDLVLGQE